MSLAKRKPHDAQVFFDRVDNNATAVFASKRVPFTLVVGRSEFILVPGAEEAGWGAAVRVVVWILATAHLLALFELCELLGDFLWQVFIDHFLQVNKNLLIRHPHRRNNNLMIILLPLTMNRLLYRHRISSMIHLSFFRRSGHFRRRVFQNLDSLVKRLQLVVKLLLLGENFYLL